MSKSKTGLREVFLYDGGKPYLAQWNYIDGVWTVTRCNVHGVVVGTPGSIIVTDEDFSAYIGKVDVRRREEAK